MTANDQRPAPLHVGLTGNIASGKSTVAALLRDRGAAIIDADVLAREAVEPGTPGLAAIVAHFGTGVLAADGSLDRQILRHLVFDYPAELDTLNAIVHPIVGQLREDRLREAQEQGVRVVVSDIPLLYETGMADDFEAVILVEAAEETRLQRLLQHRRLKEATARSMMAAQMPSAEKRPLATWVIDNDGSPDQLARQVDALWDELTRRADRHMQQDT